MPAMPTREKAAVTTPSGLVPMAVTITSPAPPAAIAAGATPKRPATRS